MSVSISRAAASFSVSRDAPAPVQMAQRRVMRESSVVV
jgi:hypothetical protein